MIVGIVAMDEAGLIGSDGMMPWYLPQELKWFQEATATHCLVMGKTTYMHLPKPLQGRKIMVVSHHNVDLFPGDELCHDFLSLLKKYETSDEVLMICGGASIYQQAMPYIKRWYISIIPGTYQGDTYFPSLPKTFALQDTIIHDGFCVYLYQR